MRNQTPSAPTFSRAFAEFLEGQLPQKIHEALIKQHYALKLAGHVSRGSSAIEAREKPTKKEKIAIS